MSYLTIGAINNWLAVTKYEVDEVNLSMEDAAVGMVFAALDVRYDIALWLDEATTPEIVQSVIAMLVAAWEYDRATAEDDGEFIGYATRLEKRALALLNSLSSGVMDIPGVLPDLEDVPGFWPTDDSTTLGATNPTDPNASPLTFSMGMDF